MQSQAVLQWHWERDQAIRNEDCGARWYVNTTNMSQQSLVGHPLKTLQLNPWLQRAAQDRFQAVELSGWDWTTSQGTEPALPALRSTVLKPSLFSLLLFLPCLFWTWNFLGHTGLSAPPSRHSSAQQGSDPSPTPSVLCTMGIPQREHFSCVHTGPHYKYLPQDHLGTAPPCNQQHHKPAFPPRTCSYCLTCMFDTICTSASPTVSQQPPH